MGVTDLRARPRVLTLTAIRSPGRYHAMQRANPSSSLFADLYELTMAQALWQSGKTATATFSLYFRHHPPGRAYYVFAGLAPALENLRGLSFAEQDIAYLRSTGLFDGGFLDFLAGLRFTGGVRAMPEGAVAFAGEPVLEVTAPLIEAQILETFLINCVNAHTLFASKAARVVHAARGKSVVDFAARRTHGPDAADAFARASYLAGFDGTSNVQAGARHGIPIVGTMAHSFISAFDDETDAFRSYAKSFPSASTLLVDTYDTLSGTRRAIQVAREMRADGHELQAIRLDSGDLAALAKRCRALLDDAGFADVRIVASGALDEYAIDDLRLAGAPIAGFGVGTKAGVSADAPWADSVYKLVAYDGRPTMKLSADKATLPGPKQVYRCFGENGAMQRDVLATASEPPPSPNARPMLAEVMRGGKIVCDLPTLTELRRRFKANFARLDEGHKRLCYPDAYDVPVSEALAALRTEVAASISRQADP